jgi:hypothetical protein
MAAPKSQAVHVESHRPGAVSPEHIQRHVSDIDQGNQAVLLRVDDDTGEKGQAGYLRLAKDHHVCHLARNDFLDIS